MTNIIKGNWTHNVATVLFHIAAVMLSSFIRQIIARLWRLSF